MATDWKDLLGAMRDSLPEGEPQSTAEAEKTPAREKKKEKLSMAMEKKGRGGKTATIIFGFEGSDEEIAAVATRLKQRLGIGGSSRGGEILLQGDVREKAKPILKELGYKV